MGKFKVGDIVRGISPEAGSPYRIMNDKMRRGDVIGEGKTGTMDIRVLDHVDADKNLTVYRWMNENYFELVERPKEGGKTMSEKPKYFIGQPVIETYRGAEGVYLGNGPREDDATTAFVRLESGEILITSPEYVKRTNTFTCSQVMAGLEQHYFKEGTRFRVNAETIFEVALTGSNKLGLRRDNVSGTICINLYCSHIHATWTLIYEGPKEMTLSEIEEALGYRVKIKEER